MQKNPGRNSQTLGEMFDCEKTQIGKLKQKDSLMSMYESNASGSRSILIRPPASEYEEINKYLYEWYTLACSKNIFPMVKTVTRYGRVCK